MKIYHLTKKDKNHVLLARQLLGRLGVVRYSYLCLYLLICLAPSQLATPRGSRSPSIATVTFMQFHDSIADAVAVGGVTMERAKTMERKQITLRIPEEVYEALKDVLEPYRQNEEKVKINLTVSEKKYKALSQIAESLEQPISTTILQIVDDYLTKF